MTMSKRTQLLLVGLFCFLLGAVVMHLPFAAAQEKQIKVPEWSHSFAVKVRNGTETDFATGTKRIGIEVYKDANNGNLVYISETGSIAVVPAGK
jgi:hypothetical protein